MAYLKWCGAFYYQARVKSVEPISPSVNLCIKAGQFSSTVHSGFPLKISFDSLLNLKGFAQREGGMIIMQNPEHSHYFQMDDDQIKEFARKVTKIKLGSTKSQVLSLFGKPSSDIKLIGKKSPNAVAERVVSYYIKKWEKDFVNEKHDKVVGFYFNSSDKLLKIRSNIEAIPSKSNP
jgi:hypothetical protein